MQSMQEHDTFPGKIYAVTCASGCTITDNKGRTLGECEAGKQTLVVATSDKLLTSADALLTATFNLAPAKLRLLGLLGGGEVSPSLPAGYLAAAFLESSGVERILINPTINGDSKIDMETEFTQYKDYGGMFGTEVRGTNYSNKRFSIMFTTKTACRVDYGPLMTGVAYTIPLKKKIRLTKDGPKNYVDGEMFHESEPKSFTGAKCALFAREYNEDGRGAIGRVWWCKIYNSNEVVCDLLPALDSAGAPCMIDIKTETPYYNVASRGAFVVGLNKNQALKLSTLPATGGSLTISLPTGYESDAGVANALETARANGWTLTIQTYTPEAEASSAATFGMRRVWVRKTQDEHGAYVDSDGKRWTVDWCVEMYTPDNSTPDQHGYELFRSVDAAVAYWELQPWVDPEAEELLTNQES